MPSTSLLTTNGWSFWNKDSTSLISQSLRGLEKWGLQQPHSQASDTQPSLSIAKRNKLGKASFSIWSSHHKSFQNLNLFPFPTKKWDLPRMPSHSLLMAFHTPHQSLLSLLSNTTPFPPNQTCQWWLVSKWAPFLLQISNSTSQAKPC